MNSELDQLAKRYLLASEESRPLALAFGLACAKRIEHLLEQAEVVDCLRALEAHVSGNEPEQGLPYWAIEAARLANQHQGSKSIDGCGHSAVSASYGVSNAIAGKAIEAASYCAYALVYSSGGYGAVGQVEAFAPEVTWQAQTLQRLAKNYQAAGVTTGNTAGDL